MHMRAQLLTNPNTAVNVSQATSRISVVPFPFSLLGLITATAALTIGLVLFELHFVIPSQQQGIQDLTHAAGVPVQSDTSKPLTVNTSNYYDANVIRY
jgi:hypothetical protein